MKSWKTLSRTYSLNLWEPISLFCNIDELQNEKPVETEKIVRDFMVDKLKLSQ